MSGKDKQPAGDRTLRLLDRELPAGYREQWTEILSQEEEEERRDTFSVVVFRLGREWMALSCHSFREFTPVEPIHRIPHRSGNVLLGITNIRGELHLAVSLHGLLEIEGEEPGDDSTSARVFRRMAVLSKEDGEFVAPIDEVAGLHRVTDDELTAAPVTLEKAAANHTRGLFRYRDHSVALLDDELLFYNLRRHVE